MSSVLELQNAQTIADTIGSMFLIFFVLNYTFLIRNFNTLYLMQLIYIVSFAVDSKAQFSSQLHVISLYIGPETVQKCLSGKNCNYLPQIIMIWIGIACSIVVGCYAHSKRRILSLQNGKKYWIRRLYFGFYSIFKLASIPVFFIFFDSIYDLKNIKSAIFSLIPLLIGLIMNILILQDLSFLNLQPHHKTKAWLDLSECILFYSSIILSYMSFASKTRHLILTNIFLMFAYCIISWGIKERLINTIEREREQLEDQDNNIEFKKRENTLQFIFLILQLIPFSVLIGYFDSKDDVVYNSSLDSLMILIFSSIQFVLILIILVLRCKEGENQQLNNYLDDDFPPFRMNNRYNEEMRPQRRLNESICFQKDPKTPIKCKNDETQMNLSMYSTRGSPERKGFNN